MDLIYRFTFCLVELSQKDPRVFESLELSLYDVLLEDRFGALDLVFESLELSHALNFPVSWCCCVRLGR